MINPIWRSLTAAEWFYQGVHPSLVKPNAQTGFLEAMLQSESSSLSRDLPLLPSTLHFTLDDHGQIVAIDAAGASFLGWQPPAILGQSINCFVPTADQPQLWQALRLVLQAPDRCLLVTLQLCCPDTPPVQMQMTVQALCGLGGRIYGLFSGKALLPAASLLPGPAPPLQVIPATHLAEQSVAMIAQQIHQSLNLKQILNTTVTEVRQLLQTDRVLILRFDPTWSGTVLVESVEAAYKPLLGKFIQAPCFVQTDVGLYQQGVPQAIADVYTAELAPCYLKLLTRAQVRAVLVVPILQGAQLWGLLVVHHCRAARGWQAIEIEMLQQLTAQVSIAIQQSELYQQVQRLNVDLERQVQKHAAQLQLASEFEATLKRITDRVRDSLDEDQILQTAVRELAIAAEVSGCNAALYDIEQRTSTVSYEYTHSLAPLQGRIVRMDNFPEGYNQLLQGQYFQFCSLLPNCDRGRVALLACPILDDQGVLGDLWLISKEFHAFSEQDIRLVQQVANQCAIALRQARLYQAAQAQVKELEKLNRLKDDFLSTVSHELRTPMSNIKLSTQMLELTLQGLDLLADPSSALAKYFQILRHECEREIGLINDLLDLSRLEAGTEPLMLSEVNLQTWIPQLVAPFAERAQSQNQHLKIDIPAHFPTFTTDLSRLERILSELLHNACKYTPAGETIVLAAKIRTEPATAATQTEAGKRQATPDKPESGSRKHPRQPQTLVAPVARRLSSALVLTVTNSGVDIAAANLGRVFDKFYRIPNHDPWRHGGTGLGLALARKLVETLDGRISAASYTGLTRFAIELPYLPPPAGNSK